MVKVGRGRDEIVDIEFIRDDTRFLLENLVTTIGCDFLGNLVPSIQQSLEFEVVDFGVSIKHNTNNGISIASNLFMYNVELRLKGLSSNGMLGADVQVELNGLELPVYERNSQSGSITTLRK
jgi:hypothetical protein